MYFTHPLASNSGGKRGVIAKMQLVGNSNMFQNGNSC